MFSTRWGLSITKHWLFMFRKTNRLPVITDLSMSVAKYSHWLFINNLHNRYLCEKASWGSAGPQIQCSLLHNLNVWHFWVHPLTRCHRCCLRWSTNYGGPGKVATLQNRNKTLQMKTARCKWCTLCGSTQTDQLISTTTLTSFVLNITSTVLI